VQDARTEGRKEGRRKGGKEGRKEGKKEGRKDHVCSQHLQLAATTGSVQSAAELLELRGFQNYFLALFGPRFGIVFGLVRNPLQKY
jgi:predicted transposase YdaD